MYIFLIYIFLGGGAKILLPEAVLQSLLYAPIFLGGGGGGDKNITA